MRFESADDFAQSGLGDFNDGQFSSSLDKTKQHFDWGKAKVVRMSDAESMDELAEDLDGFSLHCDATATSGSSFHTLSSTESSSSADSAKKKKKSASKTKEGKSSKSTKKTRSVSPKRINPRKSLGEIPEHESRENTDAEESCDELDNFHRAVSEEWHAFGSTGHRRSSAPPAMLLETMLPFGQSASPGKEQNRRLKSLPLKSSTNDDDFDNIVVKRRCKSSTDFPTRTVAEESDDSPTPMHKPTHKIPAQDKEIVFVPRYEDFAQNPQLSSKTHPLQVFVPTAEQTPWPKTTPTEVAVRIDQLLQNK
jgi:hypothetical protein